MERADPWPLTRGRIVAGVENRNRARWNMSMRPSRPGSRSQNGAPPVMSSISPNPGTTRARRARPCVQRLPGRRRAAEAAEPDEGDKVRRRRTGFAGRGSPHRTRTRGRVAGPGTTLDAGATRRHCPRGTVGAAVTSDSIANPAAAVSIQTPRARPAAVPSRSSNTPPQRSSSRFSNPNGPASRLRRTTAELRAKRAS